MGNKTHSPQQAGPFDLLSLGFTVTMAIKFIGTRIITILNNEWNYCFCL